MLTNICKLVPESIAQGGQVFNRFHGIQYRVN